MKRLEIIARLLQCEAITTIEAAELMQPEIRYQYWPYYGSLYPNSYSGSFGSSSTGTMPTVNTFTNGTSGNISFIAGTGGMANGGVTLTGPLTITSSTPTSKL